MTSESVVKSVVAIKLSDIVFDEGLYPRVKGHDPEVVQNYARDMEQIEEAGRFISINADNILIDGKHRFLAYKKLNDGNLDVEIQAFRYAISSKLETFKLACSIQELGKSLSTEDKIESAKRMYSMGENNQAEIGKELHVHQGTVSKWLSRTLKEEKERKKDAAFKLWLACHTQEEIAASVDVAQNTVTGWEKEFIEKCQEHNLINSPDFEIPIYNVWKQQNKSNAVNHFGNSEPRWLENLLYLYTNPADIIVDPFAGSGSTIDVCKKRQRRYWVADRKPIVEREHEIRKHDLVADTGVQMPPVPRWKDVKLVYLDPPYWLQAQGQYSQDPSDLANMPLEQFNETLAGIIHGFAKKLKNGEPRYIALIIQPTQWKAPERQFIDHVGDMLRLVKLPVDMRFSVPYESQQCNAQMVEWAKAHRKCLVLTRELVVWRVA
jgi:DNA-binding XRE family transcriptional regulator